MDPKDNTDPSSAKKAQTNTPPDAAFTDATQPTGAGGAPSLSPDGPADVSGADQGQGSGQGVEVDLSALPDTPAAETGDAATPATPDNATASDSASSPVAFDTDAPQAPASGDTFTASPVDSTSSTPGATPPTTSDFGSAPRSSADQQFDTDSSSSAPSTSIDPTMPGQPDGPTLTPDQPAASGVPPTAPVPGHHGDKKTIVVLGGVAVILIAAIVVLFLL